MLKKFLSITVALALSLSTLAASKLKVKEANKLGILLKGNASEPQSLDPHLAQGLPEAKILIGLFQGPVGLHPKDLSIVPGVAERWEVSDDGKTYTFFLRKQAQWSDGSPLLAKDFVDSYERLLSPKLGSCHAPMLDVVIGAKAYRQGHCEDFSTVGIVALDKHTLQITLEHPLSYFLTYLTHWAFYPVNIAAIQKNGGLYDRNNNWTKPHLMVSNGPFYLSEWKHDEVIKLEKNSAYWNKSNVDLNAIHFFPLEAEAEERSFRAQELHITESIPSAKLSVMIKEKSPFLFIHPYLGTYAYLFNTKRAPLDDVRVRKALNLSLDRQLLAEKVIGGGKNPAYQFTPSHLLGNYEIDSLNKNIAEAQSLLAQAGFPNGKNFPVLKLVYNTSSPQKLLAEAIQEMWQKNLGITIELVNQEWKTYLQSRRQGDFDLLRLSWIADYPDANAFLHIFKSDAPNNYTSWKNITFDTTLNQALSSPDPKERTALYQKAESILIDECPLIPLYLYNTAYLVHPDVKGWYGNILDVHPYEYLSLPGTLSLASKGPSRPLALKL